ncbi:MAG: hypothetical protein ACTSSM_04470 [Promethearchaeota archaeon]
MNDRSIDFWNKYIEIGKINEQIKKILSLLNEKQDYFIEEYKKNNSKFLNEDNSKLSFAFEEFLHQKVKEVLSNEKLSFKSEFLKKVFDKFKLDLLKYLQIQNKDKYICEIQFKDGYSFYKIIEALKKVNNSIIIRILNDSMIIYNTNINKTCLMGVFFQIENCNTSLIQKQEFLIDLNALIKCLKCNKSEKLSTILRFRETKIEIEQVSKVHKSKILREINEINTDFEKENIIDELIDLNYKGNFIINKNQFLHIISHIGRFSDSIKIELSRDGINIYDENFSGFSKIKWKKENIKELELTSHNNISVINSFVSIGDLKKIIPFLIENNALIKIFIDKQIPIKILLKFNSLKGTI